MTEIPTTANVPATTNVPAMADVPPPPYDDDDEPEFQPRPRRRAHALTFVLAGAMLIAAGFLGGVLLQKHDDHGSTSTASSRAGRFAAAANGATGANGTTGATGANGARANGFGGFGGNAVAGTVKLVDGKNIYVTDTNGNIVKVATTPASQLTKSVAATTKDIAPGDVVIVRGTQNSDGSYSATSVVDSTATASAAAAAG